MEAVKDQGELVGRDGVPVVADRDIGLARPGGHCDAESALLIGELDGVVQQIIAHLGDGVRIAPDLDRIIRKLGVHIQMLAVDLGLQAHQHPEHDLGDVELFLGGDILGGLEPGEVQHLPHQPGQALGL